MDDLSNHDRAVELLQELGLKEYEAKCHVALTRLPEATAKEISDVSEVPRTRIYDAVRVLESKGLVEVRHSNPKLFRAVSIGEAVETLQREYRTRVENLADRLSSLDVVESDADASPNEIWALSGRDAITARVQTLVEQASEEVLVALGSLDAASEPVLARLDAAVERGVNVCVGTATQDVADAVEGGVGGATVSAAEPTWLWRPAGQGDDGHAVNRLLLVDGRAVLVSADTDSAEPAERSVFGRGRSNGVVVLAERLLATDLRAVGHGGD
jgi:sugar-specific transcriptional regulator TrmB